LQICPGGTLEDPPPVCLDPCSTLDPSRNATFDTIEAVLRDLFTVLPDAFVHLGGDEVDTTCWDSTPRIAKWMAQKGIDADGGYGYFVSRTQAIAHKLGKTAIVWDEVRMRLLLLMFLLLVLLLVRADVPLLQLWNHFGTALDREKTVLNTRFNPSQAPKRRPCVANATSHGYRVVRSQNIHWYLDQTVQKPWSAQYDFEPCADLPGGVGGKSCTFIVGGAASMWGETVDTSDLMNTVWPRAGAVGERLWSAAAVNDSAAALPRYTAFRCYLNRRGFAAAPALNAVAREAPAGPGSCFAQ